MIDYRLPVDTLPLFNFSHHDRLICAGGYEMDPDGRDLQRYRHKFRCPFHSYPNKDQCSQSPYGKVVYIKFDTDIRLFGPVRYKNDKWKSIYKNRTSCKRINDSIINDHAFLNQECMVARERCFCLFS